MTTDTPTPAPVRSLPDGQPPIPPTRLDARRHPATTDTDPIDGAEGQAGDDRWRPARAGIVNLWRYWEETFTFHRGRLLLRGPNGSGKSMALELLLPFLLDGDASPSRLTSSAKSRGGLYDRVMAGTTDTTRAGFAWIEFRRGDDTFTVGVRVRASASTHNLDRALFTTTLPIATGNLHGTAQPTRPAEPLDRTVGADEPVDEQRADGPGTDGPEPDSLRLLDGNRNQLSRKDLVDAIGSTGRVTDSAEEHRDCVRQALFEGFTGDRYDSVIVALLALRKEKLSQHLDLTKLSGVLSEALPPLDDHDIAAVAEGFERLDRRREAIVTHEADLEALGALAVGQRRYAKAVMAATAVAVRNAESRRDTVVRKQRESVEALEAVITELDDIARQEADFDERQRSVHGELEGIRASATYTEGAQLAELQSDVRALTQELEDLETVATKRRADVDETADLLAAAQSAADVARANAEVALDELRSAAEVVGAGGLVDEILTMEAAEGHRLATGWIRARRAEITEIGELLTATNRAIDRRGQAEEARDAQRGRHDMLTTAVAEAAVGHEAAVTAHDAAVRTWIRSCSSLTESRLAAVIEALDGVTDPADGVDAVDDAVLTLRGDLASELALARDAIGRERADGHVEREALAAEMTELDAGHEEGPALAPWRTSRDDRVGAPLWASVDVTDGTDRAHIDGIEAALDGAGLLDAWISPDGSVDMPEGTADLVLGSRAVAGPSLADYLQPITDPPVDHDVIDAVLRSVAVGDATAPDDGVLVISTDGGFRLGSAVGATVVGSGSFLGAAARERHRRVERDRVAAELADCERRLDELGRHERRLLTDRDAHDADLAARPERLPVDDAAAARHDAETRLVEARERLDHDDAAVQAAESLVRDAQRSLATRCSTTGLPSDSEGLGQYTAAVDSVDTANATWQRRGDEQDSRNERRAAAEQSHDRAVRAGHDADERRDAAHGRLTSMTAKAAAIEASLGSGYDELMDRIASLDAEDGRIADGLRALRERRPDLDRRLGALQSTADQAATELTEAEEHREVTHRRFTTVFTTALPDDAGVNRPTDRLDSATSVLTCARATADALSTVSHDDDDIERASRSVEERLHQTRATVATRIDLVREESASGWLVLLGSSGGVRRPVTELTVVLGEQLAADRDELAAEETKLFERTLAGSIRHSLADRIRGANALVATINKQLAEVKTAAGGVEVRLRWDVDAEQPDAVRAARSLLLRNPADLDDTERAALQSFVRARVDQARAELELHAPWEARLRESLDYRGWHSFSLQLAHRDWTGFKPVTPRLLQKLSTGERSIALHLPMLASIAAHYTGADGEPLTCPRLILLDELFAGVDGDNRSKLFGTFTAWDLDAVFTSDHEWCQYASLDGIAIHHLHAGAGDEPVTSTRFTWDGERRALDPSAA